jgi:membrane protease YdiL (CAAX protease family)
VILKATGAWLYLGAAYALAAIGFVVWLSQSRYRVVVRMQYMGPLVLEAAIYALTLGTIAYLLDDIAPALLGGPAKRAIGSITIAAGAGLFEELAFRLAVMGSAIVVCRQLGVSRLLALVFALLASAMVFSIAHHFGPGAEIYEHKVFAYRVIAGAMFGLVYYFRSLAHAVYAHFAYDVYVLALVGAS